MLRLIVFVTILSLLLPETASGETASIVTISTPRGAEEAFILIKPDHPVASVILFVGGNGLLRLRRTPPPAVDPSAFVAGNFLVRSREAFAAHDFVVAIIDAPSDRQEGMSLPFLVSEDHAIDIGAIVEHLKRETHLPVWLVGTSGGSWSAALGAIKASHGGNENTSIDGLVLTSTVTRIPEGSKMARTLPAFAAEHPKGVMSMKLSEVRVPTLVMSHRDDGCLYTPAVDAPVLAKRLSRSTKVEIAAMTGGDPPKSDPCEAYAAHGYFGVENQAVDRIARFIKANGPRKP
jgi:hypothetical protein